MYKIAAIDLDGTMLNKYGAVTDETKSAIKQTIEKGTDVIIASGRPIDSIKTIAEEIGSNNYFIAGNGSLIYDIKNDQIMYEKFLNKQKVLEIAGICEENSISYNIYTEETIIAKQLKHNVLYYYKENLKKEEKNNETENSKDAAKERLHLVLMQDRANVSADFLELMKQEIIEVIKKLKKIKALVWDI